MTKTVKFKFFIDDEVVIDGRPAWVEHIQMVKDGRTLFYCATTEASGRPVSAWYDAALLAQRTADADA